MPNIALFDLDYTLIDFDSDHGWGEYLCELGRVDADWYRAMNDKFYADYRAGRLDMQAFLDFSLKPLGEIPVAELFGLRKQFMQQVGEGKILRKARELVALHKSRGDRTAIVTATNRFVTEPFAEAFGVDQLLATNVKWKDGRPLAEADGPPCFREGKIGHVKGWLDGFGGHMEDCSFYSDSHNDLPLLGAVGRAVAVDPDPTLLKAAAERGWDVISLR